MTRFGRILATLMITLAVGAQAFAGARQWVLCLGDCMECAEPEPERGDCCSGAPAQDSSPAGPCQEGDCPCFVVPLSGSIARAGGDAPPTHELAVSALLLSIAPIDAAIAVQRQAGSPLPDPPRPPPGPPLSTIVLLI